MNQYVLQEKEPMLLQHDNARTHTSAVTVAVTTMDLKLLHTLPTAWILHQMTSGSLCLSRTILNKFTSYMTMQLKLLWENYSENG
jgi:long-subunit acyl-CoA synthetase (AMP-forming)